MRAGLFDGPKHPGFREPVRQPRTCQREPGRVLQRQRESKQGGEFPDATTRHQHLAPEFCLSASEIGEPHHLCGLSLHPATSGRLRYAAGDREPKVPGVLEGPHRPAPATGRRELTALCGVPTTVPVPGGTRPGQ